MEPTRLPTSDATHTAMSWLMRTLRALRPWSMYMTLPVNSSAPAKTTRVRAIPNTAPCTSLVAAEPDAARGPATLTSSTTATPTYPPANAELNRYRGRRRTCSALVRARLADSARASGMGMGMALLLVLARRARRVVTHRPHHLR